MFTGWPLRPADAAGLLDALAAPTGAAGLLGAGAAEDGLAAAAL
jgi:hypothetical protein